MVAVKLWPLHHPPPRHPSYLHRFWRRPVPRRGNGCRRRLPPPSTTGTSFTRQHPCTATAAGTPSHPGPEPRFRMAPITRAHPLPATGFTADPPHLALAPPRHHLRAHALCPPTDRRAFRRLRHRRPQPHPPLSPSRRRPSSPAHRFRVPSFSLRTCCGPSRRRAPILLRLGPAPVTAMAPGPRGRARPTRSSHAVATFRLG